MNNILDLSCYTETTLPIKFADGKTINVCKPSQRILIAMMAFDEQRKKGATVVEQLDGVNTIITMILNNNKQLITFDTQMVSNLPFDAKIAIIKAYGEFANTLLQDPNLLCP